MRQLRFRLSASRAIRLFLIGAILMITLTGNALPVIKSLDNALLNWRFAATPRPASGNLVYLAIDKRTLDYVGTWPWPRNIYAKFLDKLSLIGVDDIFIDIDFSTPSTASEDARLNKALSEAGGGVVLPVFKQHRSADAGGPAVVTQPLNSFADNAWLAFANVALDADGTIRRFELGDLLDGRLIQSVAGVLSKTPPAVGTRLIDYSIEPSTVPTISLSEILEPDFDGASLHARSIVIGAYATELKDVFPVPVYGQLPGPMLHILAAETILQGRTLKESYQLPAELATAAAIVAAALALRTAPVALPFLLAFGLLIGGEAVAFVLQRDQGLVIHTATCWTSVCLALVLMLTEKVDFSRFLAEVASAEQRNIRRLLCKIVTDSTDAVLAFDHRFMIFEESDSARAMLGWGDIGYKGQRLAKAVPGALYDLVLELAADHEKEPNIVQSAASRFPIALGGSVKHLEATITISPMECPDEAGGSQSAGFVGSLMIRDMTARQLYEEQLQYLSHYDDLTGLMNRRAFSEHLRDCHQPMYFAVIGLHRFSVLNATMGRDIGDDLLRAVANRLTNDPRIVSAGRLGGDVFAIAIHVSVFSNLEDCAQAVLGLFDIPLELANSQIRLSARLGICSGVAIGEDTDLAVERAEHALDAAKTVAGSGWRAYDMTAAQQQHRSRQLEHAMRASLKNGEFFLLYQPQVELQTGALHGAEALLRWKHPEFGWVSPGTFIPVAEANGFVCELGRWALVEACLEAMNWPERLSVSVNVAPIQLIRTDLVADVRQALNASGLPASRLHLEITESALVDHSGPTVGAIKELRNMGVKIALDDFGTGYSSLSYMADFPLDELKIDQSFVRRMANDPQSLTIVRTVKGLAGA
uniref:EAL domain-containing protein n=1 Tax=Neorhizobium sp. EC2-8 TaxID=3129230 RepID=UPI0031011760